MLDQPYLHDVGDAFWDDLGTPEVQVQPLATARGTVLGKFSTTLGVLGTHFGPFAFISWHTKLYQFQSSWKF